MTPFQTGGKLNKSLNSESSLTAVSAGIMKPSGNELTSPCSSSILSATYCAVIHSSALPALIFSRVFLEVAKSRLSSQMSSN
ncbi:Uncharacterised protein [Vibrio cholerae]|nr:Uncharacterised protein [Vibrio cholerae]